MQALNLTGQRFGRLIALERAPSSSRAKWVCQCDCGSLKAISALHLRKGDTLSYRCLHAQRTSEAKKTHGFSRTPEHNAWLGMKARCYNEKNGQFHNYGARGISVCERWLESFLSFLDDVGERPSSSHSIDRRDNDGNYEPGNCYWATKTEQARNTRSNLTFDVAGERMSLIEITERCNLPYKRIHLRLQRGKGLEDAVGKDIFRAVLTKAPTPEKEPA